MDTRRFEPTSTSRAEKRQNLAPDCDRLSPHKPADSRQQIRDVSTRGGIRDRSGISEGSLRFAAKIHQQLDARNPVLGEEFLKRFANELVRSAAANKDPITRAAETALQSMAAEGHLTADCARQVSKKARTKAEPSTASCQTSQPIPAPAIRTSSGHSESSFRVSSAKGTDDASPQRAPLTSSNPAPLGFLWKPVSESDGNLVVLLPEDWSELALDVRAVLPDGSSIKGSFKDFFEGTKRGIFRFDRPGSEFPAGAVLSVTMRDGTTRNIKIPNPGNRFEGR